MSIFEYMSMVVAIVLGISITNLLNKLAITLRVGSWGTLWFRSLWCVILLICTIGYLWAFWRIYVDYTEISIWSFIFGPFFTVVCFFLISVLLPIPRECGTDSDAFDVFLEQKKNEITKSITKMVTHRGNMNRVAVKIDELYEKL